MNTITPDIGDRIAVKETYFTEMGVLHSRLTWGTVTNLFTAGPANGCPFTGEYAVIDCGPNDRTFTVFVPSILLIQKS